MAPPTMLARIAAIDACDDTAHEDDGDEDLDERDSRIPATSGRSSHVLSSVT